MIKPTNNSFKNISKTSSIDGIIKNLVALLDIVLEAGSFSDYDKSNYLY